MSETLAYAGFGSAATQFPTAGGCYPKSAPGTILVDSAT
jgi:hypothetical protein